VAELKRPEANRTLPERRSGQPAATKSGTAMRLSDFTLLSITAPRSTDTLLVSWPRRGLSQFFSGYRLMAEPAVNVVVATFEALRWVSCAGMLPVLYGAYCRID
jgi:hypothetical protein